jgi:hypothetical protein
MKIFAILGLTLLILVIGAFAFIGLSDAPVTQTTLTRDIETAPTQAAAPAAPAMPAVTAPIVSPTPAVETAPATPVAAPTPESAPTETPAPVTPTPAPTE